MKPGPEFSRLVIRCLLALYVLVTELPANLCQAQDYELFEAKIRPALHEHCLACHHQGKKSGGLALDSKEGVRSGGDSGPALAQGDPQASLLVRVLEHSEPGLEMPLKAPKLSRSTIDAFIEWIRNGAPDPRVVAEPIGELKKQSWEDLYRERSSWWAFAAPNSKTPAGLSRTEAIDYWINRKIAETGILASRKADTRVLLRRLCFSLQGLPPSVEFLDRFQDGLSSDGSDNRSWALAVDTVLDSPEFAEHWTRHWMDIVRYAETHGSEDDAYLPFAYRYRDYLIRAFGSDLPVGRLIQEHLAGDLLTPRLNEQLKINESPIGTAFLRMVEFNQTPVDVKREEIAVIDNQIDTIGKAFQGLTISCARCHDHKFDPISDEDYYALYGVLRSTRVGSVCIDAPDSSEFKFVELEALQHELGNAALECWREETLGWGDEISDAIRWGREHTENGSIKPGQKWDEIKNLVGDEHPWRKVIARWLVNPGDAKLATWLKLLHAPAEQIPSILEQLQGDFNANQSAWESIAKDSKTLFDLRSGGLSDWRINGSGLPTKGLKNTDLGEASLRWAFLGGKKYPMSRLLEAGYHSNISSDRASGVLRSPDFEIQSDSISLLCRGSDNARARLVIENFQGDSLLFDTVNPTLRSNTLQWVTMRIRPQWKGLRAHLELLTRDAKPYVGIVKDPANLEGADGRSSFGLAMVLAHDNGFKLPIPWSFPDPSIQTTSDILESTVLMTRNSLERLVSGRANENDIRWVNLLMDEEIFDWNRKLPKSVLKLNEKVKAIESRNSIPRWSPGVIEDFLPVNQRIMLRGDHKNLGPEVPRKFLSILGSNPSGYNQDSSGRYSLAMEITDSSNPLTARVYVNRVWSWLFGEGLVRTVDNFGRMGTLPSHPELLDQLAIDFIKNGWSNKQLIRSILLSDAWQRSSSPSDSAIEKDPAGIYLGYYPLRRVQAESIRDTMLWVAGNLKRPDGGLSTKNFYTSVLEPNKQSPPGPIDGDSRRSMYLEVRRNFPDEFLSAFDFPKPTATTGKRYTTNTPLQSLMLLNDPFVLLQSQRWAHSLSNSGMTPRERIELMYRQLLSRNPEIAEMESALELIDKVSKESGPSDAWSTLAHAMFNLKEAWHVK